MKGALIAAALFLAFACAAKAAIPYERAVTAPVYGVPPGGRSVAAIASDGEGALLVWSDYGRGAIYASRLGANGIVADMFGTRIETTQVFGGPFVFWSGSAYLLLWSERDGLHAAQLDASGSVIAAPRVVAPDIVQPYSAASNGTRVVMPSNGRLWIFDLTGRLVETFPMLAETLTSNGDGFLVSYRSAAQDLYVTALDPSGHPAGLSHYIASNVSRLAAQASNGNEYLLVISNAPINGLLPVRIAADGSLLPTPGFVLPYGNWASLSWTGSDYLYTWSRFDPAISAMHFDASSGARHGASEVLVNDVGQHAVAGIGGGSFVLTWVGFDGGIRAEAVDPVSLTHTAAVLVSVSAAEQVAPHIAWSGRNYLVVWQERSAILAMRMDDMGRTLDGAGIAIASSAASNPNVVFDGANFVVSWMTGGTLWLNRIDPDSGALLDGIGSKFVADTIVSYGIASAGANGTMLALESTEHYFDRRLLVLRVDRALQPSGAPLAITPAGMLAHNPSAAWSGTQWLVAFEEEIPVPAYFDPVPADWNRADIRAVRLTPSMTPLDTEPLSIAVSADTGPRHRAPYAASSGDDDLIAWSYGFNNGAHDVLARRVQPNGTLGATMNVTAGRTTSAISTPGGYAIGITTPANDAIGSTLDGFFKISVTNDDDRNAALVWANGRLTAAYMRVATEVPYGAVSRVFVRDARPWHGRAAGH